MNLKILAFGEVLWDIVEDSFCIGGAPLNFCGHCVRLGDEASIISAVGKDDLGQDTLKALGELGICSNYIAEVDLPTGTVPVTLKEGIPSYDIKKGSAWDAIPEDETLLDKIAGVEWDLFYLGTLAQRSVGNEALLDKIFHTPLNAKHVFFDINLRQDYYSESIIRKSLKRASIVKLNDEELVILRNMIRGTSHDDDVFVENVMRVYDIEILCVTRGKQGADLYTENGKHTFMPGDVSVVSTVGAGDSFSAGLVHGLLTTGSVETAGELAVAISDYVVGRKGAIPKYDDDLLGVVSV